MPVTICFGQLECHLQSWLAGWLAGVATRWLTCAMENLCMSERSALPSWATMSAIICCAIVLPTLQDERDVRRVGVGIPHAVACQAGQPAFRQSCSCAVSLQGWGTSRVQPYAAHIGGAVFTVDVPCSATCVHWFRLGTDAGAVSKAPSPKPSARALTLEIRTARVLVCDTVSAMPSCLHVQVVCCFRIALLEA